MLAHRMGCRSQERFALFGSGAMAGFLNTKPYARHCPDPTGNRQTLYKT